MRSSSSPFRVACPRAARTTRRRGFTMIELLVVVAIILVLVGLVVRVAGTAINNSRVVVTKQRIKVVQDALGQRLDSFTRYFSVEQNLKNQPEYQQALTEASGDLELTKILAKKKLMKRFFPQNFQEISKFSGLTNPNDGTESAEVLYYILTQGTELGEPAIVAGAFDANSIKDTDGDGRLEIVDGWGKPLRFYRWPTRLVKTDGSTISTTYLSILDRTAPSATTQLGTDQDDPLGKTSSLPAFEANYHTPATYHLLLVVSAGEDGALGLYEPSDFTNFGYLAAPNTTAGADLIDNYTNLNVTVGGN